MIKILHIKSNILNFKLDKEGGGVVQNGQTGGFIRGGKGAPLTVTKVEAAQGQTAINQKVAAKMHKILPGLFNMQNITKENSG